ncbi:MAG: hypothetical protein ABI395_10125 [Sphingobium sp.]
MPPEIESADLPTLLPQGLSDKVAAELDQMREDLEDIGVSLCLDDAVMQRCMIYLQRLDELGQRANWLAELIRSEDPHSRVEDITLHALAHRLRA